ncbi:MAG: hypothetical protein ACP5E5_05695 [Acidobacteriaceae bacterium]
MNHLPDDPDQIPPNLQSLQEHIQTLEQNLRLLESRVAALEHPLAAHVSPMPAPRKPETEATLSSTEASEAPNLFPVAGRAMLGIAGAYLLRAMEQTSAIPAALVALVGILYAFLWLIWAAFVRSGPRITSSVYAGTSALILAPMLWELTLRFHILTAAAAAATICGFALTSLLLAALARWQTQQIKPVVRVATITAAGLAFALAAATHVYLPFIVALLLLAAVCESMSGCRHTPEVAVIVALAADAAVWLLGFAYSGGPAVPQGFPPLSRVAWLAPGILIFVLFAVSNSVKTMLHKQKITLFAVLQTTLTFLLAAGSLARLDQAAGTRILGAVCLALSVFCYLALFSVFARASEPRNRAVFGAWAAALLLAGGFLGLPSLGQTLLFSAAALGAVTLCRQDRWSVFEFYAMLFLLSAAAASGLLRLLNSAVAGAPTGASSVAVWVITACALLCYLLLRPAKSMSRMRQTLDLLLAALAVSSIVALLLDALLALLALRSIPAAHALALIRTAVLCTTALALLFSGARFRRQELTRLGYTVLLLLGVKLLSEDLRSGHLASSAASIFLVAFTLTAAPRVVRVRQKA